MPTNKNALIRYKYLDRLLSDHYHYYDIHDLTDKVNDMLYEDGFPEVTQRCIEKDLNTLEYAPFNAPVERFSKQGKRCIAYSKRSFSIFTKELSNEESNLLREVLSTIGQFDGLDNFKWLDDFKIGLGLEERRQIICFANNPYLQNSNLLGTLFDNISNEVVIRLSYHTFSDESIRSIDFHPYLLKQYNERWFLLGAADSDQKILNFALDRIDKVEPLPEKKYVECSEDLRERFEDIIGVTLYEDRPVEHIVCWVSDISKGYVVIRNDGSPMFEHRAIMEAHIGRKLADNEVVHHITDSRERIVHHGWSTYKDCLGVKDISHCITLIVIMHEVHLDFNAFAHYTFSHCMSHPLG